jgi:hypothetical protein
MAHNDPPKTLGEVIDELVERIQGDLLSLQRSPEKLEAVETWLTTATPKGDYQTAEACSRIAACGIMFAVEKPELILESKPEHHFLRGRCSLCPRVRFNLVGNTLAEKAILRQMFDIHVREVHSARDGKTLVTSEEY